MVAALVELGHRRIAFLAGPASLYVSHRRQEGYRRGLAEAGIAYDERLVVSTGFNRDGGALGIDALLAGDAPFTAVCAANDLLALGALQRLAALGIDVPARGLRRGVRRHPDGRDGHARPVHGPAAAARDRPSGVRLRGGPARRRRAGSARCCRPSSSCADRPAPPPAGPVALRRHGTAGRGRPDGRRAGGSGRPRHRQQPRHRRRGGRQGGRARAPSVAVHYHRSRGRARRRRWRGSASAGADGAAFDADVADGRQAEQLVERVIERFGRVDGLVNNAGRTQVGPFLEIEPAAMGRGHPAPT